MKIQEKKTPIPKAEGTRGEVTVKTRTSPTHEKLSVFKSLWC